MSVHVWCSTDGARRGAIASIELAADNGPYLESLFDRVGMRTLGVGDAVLRSLEGIDDGVLTRWSGARASFMVHGSPLIVDAAIARFVALGCVLGEVNSSDRFPEAETQREAMTLSAMARSRSALTVDVLLAQSRLWSAEATETVSEGAASALGRLIVPPTVVAIGHANVGKSSLLNALARRSVVVVSPEAGTTRDGVGVELDLGGLTVRWFDTPGVRAGESSVDRRARDIADRVVEQADLVIVCGDLEHGWAQPPAGAETLRCATRSDLGVVGGGDLATSTTDGDGIGRLASVVRERLVPPSALEEGLRRRWAFDEAVARRPDGG